jgi:hypothetical protein
MQIPEEKVKNYSLKNYSLKKYPCKRNKGEHEYLDPVIQYEPVVNYVYMLPDKSIMQSQTPHTEYKLLEMKVGVGIATTCKHCGHKNLTFLSGKL